MDELENIKETINNADFFAIDCEFTGLFSERSITSYDTPEEYYQKTYDSTQGFILLQFGLTAFKANTNKYVYKSYNIYTYPRSKEITFKCQGESMSFLAENGFDFNRLFRDGISCSTLAYAEKRRANLLERQNERAESIKNASNGIVDTSNHIPVSGNDQIWLGEVQQDIDTFIKSDDKEILFVDKNGFQKKLIYQLIEAKFNDKVSTSNRELENKTRALVIEKKRSIQEELKLDEEKVLKENHDLENMIGLTTIIDLLSKSVSIYFCRIIFIIINYAFNINRKN